MDSKKLRAALRVKLDAKRSRTGAAAEKWIPHELGCGFVCKKCGYHGRHLVGRDIHDRRGCDPVQPPKNEA